MTSEPGKRSAARSARAKLARFRRSHSYSARAEAEVRTLGSAVRKDLRDVTAGLARTTKDTTALTARIAALEKQSTTASSGVAELLRRPLPTAPRPPRVLTGITEQNAVLVGLHEAGPEPRVVLVLNGLAVDAIFAGVRTALVTAAELARRLDRPLAVVVLEPLAAHPDVVRTGLLRWLTDELDAADLAARLTLSTHERPLRSDLHRDDVWLVTYWTTALQVGRLCDDGLVDPERVVYLVQDWEPGFYPWGTEYALALGTYERGFQLMVNSAPLAAYVAEQTGRPVPDLVFAPEVDEQRLRLAADAWTPGEPSRPRVLFYARPTKPRNLYALGLSAVRRWADSLPDGVRPIVTFAGEDMIDPDVGPRAEARNVGKVSFERYYELLAGTDAGLTLMHSPHPSHLALELPMVGIATVTNALGRFRQAWLPDLAVVPATPEALATALGAQVDAAAGRRTHAFTGFGDTLGGPLSDCIDRVVERLAARATT